MRELGKLLGWIAMWGYIIALFNFFIKYINKKYISKLSNDKDLYIKIYRFIMKYIIRYHKIIGIFASVALLTHLYIIYNFIGLSIPGLIAGITMLLVVILGIYGFFINKRMRSPWIKFHKTLAFVLIGLVIFHVMFSRLLLIHR